MQQYEYEKDQEVVYHKSQLLIIGDENMKAKKMRVMHPCQIHQENNLGGSWQAMNYAHINGQEEIRVKEEDVKGFCKVCP